MNSTHKITSALISVFDKEGLAPIIQELNKQGVTLYSTGGTEKFIRDMGIEVVAVEDITSYPSILGGRVKTLHPKVFGGILNRQNVASDQQELKQYEIPQLDLVIVDLYPFENTVASGASEQDIIEKIDIGGISLIRAAAKNFADVLCVSDKNDYKKYWIYSLRPMVLLQEKTESVLPQKLFKFLRIMMRLFSTISTMTLKPSVH